MRYVLIVNSSFEWFALYIMNLNFTQIKIGLKRVTVGLKKIDERMENLPGLTQYLFKTNFIFAYFYAILYLQKNLISPLDLHSEN